MFPANQLFGTTRKDITPGMIFNARDTWKLAVMADVYGSHSVAAIRLTGHEAGMLDTGTDIAGSEVLALREWTPCLPALVAPARTGAIFGALAVGPTGPCIWTMNEQMHGQKRFTIAGVELSTLNERCDIQARWAEWIVAVPTSVGPVEAFRVSAIDLSKLPT